MKKFFSEIFRLTAPSTSFLNTSFAGIFSVTSQKSSSFFPGMIILLSALKAGKR